MCSSELSGILFLASSGISHKQFREYCCFKNSLFSSQNHPKKIDCVVNVIRRLFNANRSNKPTMYTSSNIRLFNSQQINRNIGKLCGFPFRFPKYILGLLNFPYSQSPEIGRNSLWGNFGSLSVPKWSRMWSCRRLGKTFKYEFPIGVAGRSVRTTKENCGWYLQERFITLINNVLTDNSM